VTPPVFVVFAAKMSGLLGHPQFLTKNAAARINNWNFVWQIFGTDQ
jgi:hypothetical protein